MKAASVASKLKAAGLPVIACTEGNEYEDGEIKITKGVSVQVGVLENYLIASRFDGDQTFYNAPTRRPRDILKVVADIRAFIADEAEVSA